MLFKNSFLVLASLAVTSSSSWAFQGPSATVRPSTSSPLFGGAMDDLSTGTKAYMDLYPEQSTDGSLRLGNIVPDFSCETTQGPIKSFHEWKKGKVRCTRYFYMCSSRRSSLFCYVQHPVFVVQRWMVVLFFISFSKTFLLIIYRFDKKYRKEKLSTYLRCVDRRFVWCCYCSRFFF